MLKRNIKVKENLLNASLDEALQQFDDGKCTMEGLTDYLEVNEDASLELFKCFYITDLNEILGEFREEVKGIYLFDKIPDWWAYSIYVDTSGVSLHLDYYADNEARPHLVFQNTAEPDIEPDQEYTLLKVESRLMKVEEYAEIFKVDPPAVRQWIRRGKLPEAIKFGREWRIPELCDVGGSTYYRRQYFWHTELTDLPEEYKFLNGFCSVVLMRDNRDKKNYFAIFYDKTMESVVKVLNIKEREQLELVLISNPLISVDDQCLAHITRKKGQGVYLEPFDGSDDNEMLRREP